MTNEFIFIGEHKNDDDQLLVKGSDGEYYAYEPERDHFERIDLDEDAWQVEQRAPEDAMPPDPISPGEIDLD